MVPQALETKELTPIKDAGVSLDGDGWAAVNPYRSSPEHDKAVEIGASAYNQNCAACHGLEAKSGGIAPDLRMLDAGDAGDEWFAVNGYVMARSAMAVCTCRRWPITSARKPCGRCAPTPWTACTSRGVTAMRLFAVWLCSLLLWCATAQAQVRNCGRDHQRWRTEGGGVQGFRALRFRGPRQARGVDVELAQALATAATVRLPTGSMGAGRGKTRR